jgi:hypothetical protein
MNASGIKRNNTISEGTKQSFYHRYEDICALTSGGLLFRYPQLCVGYPSLPIIKKQMFDVEHFQYIGFQNTRRLDNRSPRNKTVGFFLPDEKFEHLCYRPWDYIEWLSQYRQVLSPDCSCYSDMALPDQWFNIYLNRLTGVFWQECGLKIAATISWGDESSFAFCFDGVEKGAVVAVSTIGTGKVKNLFMAGFREMCRAIEPEFVICYCGVYPEMHCYAHIIPAEHEAHIARRRARDRPLPGQLSFFNVSDKF